MLCFPAYLQGINLSGGQRQRISVARALYQQTNVVFLVSRCHYVYAAIRSPRCKHLQCFMGGTQNIVLH